MFWNAFLFPPDLAEEVTASVSVPTIGIGAGPSCDGQVLVCYDLLGMFPDLQPKFAKRFAEVGEQIMAATRAYVGEVRERTFPAAEHTFKPNGTRSAKQVEARPPTLTADDIPPHWQFYFTVDDIEAAQKRVIDAGGKVLLLPMDVPGGSRILQATDDQDGHFALMQGPKS